MKRKFVSTIVAVAMLLGIGASAAGATPPVKGDRGKPVGVACQQAGIGTLQDLGLLSAVAADGIEVVGVGVVDFADVLALHRTMPDLFQSGGVSVVVPGLGVVPATWCDGL